MVVEIEAIAHLGSQVEVVSLLAVGMLVLQSAGQIESVLADVVACARTDIHIVHVIVLALYILMVVAEAAIEHPGILEEIAGRGIQSESELGILAVGHVQS